MTEVGFGYSGEVVALDTERILTTLAEHGVQYVLIGGLAAIAHGSTVSTADADIVPEGGPQNLGRLVGALTALDAKILIEARRSKMESEEPWEVIELRRGPTALLSAEAWHFTTSAGPIDVVIRAAGVGRFESHVDASGTIDVFGLRIRVAGISDLISSKEALGRPKDEIMLRELKELTAEPPST